MFDHLLITCEHAGNQVPAPYRHLFASRRAQAALDSHRGFDPGALTAARFLASRLDAALLVHRTTRLLVEVNRSTWHRHLFSEFSRRLDDAARAEVMARYYHPHRARVDTALGDLIASGGRVLHVGVHSFTARLGDVRRTADVGLLFDPAREHEARLCRRWQQQLRDTTALAVRRNYPYRGSADGLTTTLRRSWPATRYLGLELEINQDRLVRGSPASRRALVTALADGLDAVRRR